MVESTREQAAGLKEINEAVITMDRGTQQNAAMVEESTAASHNLATEVDALNRLLATSRTGEPLKAAPDPMRQDAKPAAVPARPKPQKPARALASRGNAAIAHTAESWEEF